MIVLGSKHKKTGELVTGYCQFVGKESVSVVVALVVVLVVIVIVMFVLLVLLFGDFFLGNYDGIMGLVDVINLFIVNFIDPDMPALVANSTSGGEGGDATGGH